MSNYVLAGNLNFLSLGDILQLLGSNSSTGVLRIMSRYAQQPGYIYMANGNPIDASAGSSVGLDALNSLFGWMDGEFEFSEKEVNRENVVKKSRMEIILDALSMLDDGQIEKLGPVTYEKKDPDSPDKAVSMPVVRGPLVDYMYVVDEEDFYDGTKIAEEGKHGSWIWVILEGVVEIAKETPQGPLTLLRMGEGAFVGSIASFLMGKYVRNASATASGNVQLGVLDSQRLASEFSSMTADFRGFISSLDNRLKKVTDKIVEIHLNKNGLQELIKGKKPVIKQGEKKEKLFTITRGEAYIVRHTDNVYIPLAGLNKGDFFGHVPFLDIGHEPYSASVFGSDDLEMRVLKSANLQKEYNKLSQTFKNIVEHVTTCLSVSTKLASDFQKKNTQEKTENS